MVLTDAEILDLKADIHRIFNTAAVIDETTDDLRTRLSKAIAETQALILENKQEMCTRDAEILEFIADLDRVNITILATEENKEDWEISMLDAMLKDSDNSNTDELGETLKKLRAEFDHLKKTIAENAELVKDLTTKLLKAVAEKHASSSQ